MKDKKMTYFDTVKLPKQFSGSQEDIDWIFHDILFEDEILCHRKRYCR